VQEIKSRWLSLIEGFQMI